MLLKTGFAQTFCSVLLFLSLKIVFLPAQAQWHEYSQFSESESNILNSPLQIDSEYHSDMLTYRLPFSMASRFLKESKVFDITTGSLSGTRFATQQRLKIDQSLTTNLTLRLVYFDKEDFEQSHQLSLIELQYSLIDWLSVATYTNFASEKKHNDLGVALILTPESDMHLRLFATISDYSFNKRTELNEKDLETSKTFGLVARWLPLDSTLREDSRFIEFFVSHQTPVKRYNFDNLSMYDFKEQKLGALGRWSVFEKSFVNFDLSYKRRKEGFLEPANHQIWNSHFWDILLQFEDPRWIVGVSNTWRDWQNGSEGSQQRFLLPHVWLKWGHDQFSQETWRLGLESTWSYMRGSSVIMPPESILREFEHRVNLRYSIHFNEKASLHLLLTGDIDDPSWEGGNGQFQIYF